MLNCIKTISVEYLQYLQTWFAVPFERIHQTSPHNSRSNYLFRHRSNRTVNSSRMNIVKRVHVL